MQVLLNHKIKKKDGKNQRVREPQLDEDQNQITDNFGNPLFKDGDWFTLRSVLEEVCIAPIPRTSPQSGRPEEISTDHKKMLFKIFHRLQDAKETMELSTGEVETLKPYINRRYNSPLTVGQVFNIIDPHNEDWSLNEKKKKGHKDIPSGKKK